MPPLFRSSLTVLSLATLQSLSAATVTTISFNNATLAANGLTAISPSAPASGSLPGSNIHGYAFQNGVPSSQVYSGTSSGALDYGISFGAAGGVTGGSFSATTYNGTTAGVSVGFATIYDTEIAVLSNRNGNDVDLQRVERNGGEGLASVNGVQKRWSWGRTNTGVAAALGIGGIDTATGTTLGTGGADRGNVGNSTHRYVAYGALIAQEGGNGPSGFNSNGFINALPDDVSGGTIIVDIANPSNFNYTQVAFDFVDMDEGAGNGDVVVFIETTDGFIRRFSVDSGEITGANTVNGFGSSVDGGISRTNKLNVLSPGNGFMQGTTNLGASNGSVTPTGSIRRVIIDYQGISGAVGTFEFTSVPEPSSALCVLLGGAFLLRRRRN